MIIIVDFGSQTCHLIGRRLKDIGTAFRIVEPKYVLKELNKHRPKGIILSGGPSSVYEKNAPTVSKQIFNLNIPILGICYGWQLTAQLLGGKVRQSYKEYGPAQLIVAKNEPLLSHIDSFSVVWMSHGDSVVEVPKGFFQLGRTEKVEYAAVCDIKRNIYGVQFHPEVEHTVYGQEVLKNFVKNICKIRLRKKEINIDELIRNIKKEIGSNKLICAVSGGVDSTVAAALIARAVGKQLRPIYIESGLMRDGTKEEVVKIFTRNIGIKPIIVEAKREFLKRLKGITDPEKKRKIIGKLFIDLFEKNARKLKGIRYLAQGTIYSDVIESKGTKHASKIKSHHNVGGLPKKMKLKLHEPLRNFYKDEVRNIGVKLGLPDEIVYKQVFPGPGLAIRIIGEITNERLAKIQKADNIVIDEVKKADLYNKVYMSFPVLTNIKSTAVKGDGRSYMEVVAIRIIESKDIMTTNWSRISYDVLAKISSRIVNEVPEVSRVVYDITTKPPATMEWE